MTHTMTREQILEIVNNVYRNNITPGIATEILYQQLSAERERYDELKSKYDALVMDNATLEYNAAEAEKHLPDVIKQFVDQERERAAKLVGALNIAIGVFDLTGYEKTSKILKEYIKEYQSKNQDHTKPSS